MYRHWDLDETDSLKHYSILHRVCTNFNDALDIRLPTFSVRARTIANKQACNNVNESSYGPQ
jgi:hypothetical protein